MKSLFLCLSMIVSLSLTFGQETGSSAEPPRIPDDSFHPEIKNPKYPRGEGPIVLIDEGHNNFHTASGTYGPFSSLIRRDGYTVKPCRTKFNRELLKSCKLLVIADAMPLKDGQSPFSEEEINILQDWVREGGSFFLITDHFPDPAAVDKLSAAFGVKLNNGYVLNGFPNQKEEPIVFKRSKGTLGAHPITEGFDNQKKIDSVATFCGCAFKASADFIPLLIFGPGQYSWMPQKPYDLKPDTPKIEVEGWFQGAVSKQGKGKVAIFGEAAMFTAQLFGEDRTTVGMNHPAAKGNAQFLLNLIHWLSDADDPQAQ
jgi:hypothetical protein